MKRTLVSLAALGSLIFAPGCLKQESKMAMNPDGSGKFRIVTEIDTAPLAMLGGGGANNPFGKPKEMLKAMIAGMPGVDVWTEASASTTKGGKTVMTMGGLIKDMSAMGDMSKMLDSVPNADEMPEDLKAALKDFKVFRSEKDASGNWVISTVGLDDIMKLAEAAQKAAVAEGKGGEAPPPVTEEQIAQGLEQARTGYAQFKPMAAQFLGSMNITYEVEVGGTIQEAVVFKKKSDTVATWTFTGQQLLDLVDEVLGDEDLPAKVMKLMGSLDKGIGDARALPAIREFIEPYVTKLVGSSKAPKLVVKAGANLFDYEAEAAKAKAAQSPELKALLEDAAKLKAGAAAPAESGKSVPLPPGKKRAVQ